MKKILEFIKKYDVLFMIIIIAIAIFFQSFYQYLTPTDKMWNFGNTYKLYLGNTIYQEAKIIITPLFFYIGEFLFKVFGANFFIFNIYGYLLNIIMYFLIYKILRKLSVSKKLSSIISIALILITRNGLAGNGANYNILALIFMEIGILHLLYSKNNKKTYIIQGIIMFLTLFTYQKMGVGYLLALLLLEIWNNKNIKIAIKNLSISIGIMLILIFVFIIYEKIIGNLYDFINMCILGIGEFGKENLATDWQSIDDIFLIITTIIGSIIIIKVEKNLTIKENYILENRIEKNKNANNDIKELAKNKINKNKQELKKITNNKTETKRKEIITNIKILLSFSLGSILISIPIFNSYHMKISIIIWTILLIYCIYTCISEILQDDKLKKIINMFILFEILFIVVQSLYYIYIYNTMENTEKNNKNKNDMYYGAFIDELAKEKINKINNYIEEEKKLGFKVVIFSSEAMMYSKNYDSNNKYFDLPFKGNFGSKGQNGIIEEIKKLDKTIILMENKDRSHYEIYQFSNLARDYVTKEYMNKGNIQNYDIYVTKDIENKIIYYKENEE